MSLNKLFTWLKNKLEIASLLISNQLIKLCGFLILFFLLSLSLSAQTPSLSGQWKGKIYQTNGSVKTEYDIDIYLHHLPDKIEGRSYIYADDIYAEIKIAGTLTKESLFEFRDIEIIQSKQGQEMSWCMKKVRLKLSTSDTTWELKGNWTGKNEYSQCNPGTIVLRKVTNRA